jgi:PAS domain S-box-containing protein
MNLVPSRALLADPEGDRRARVRRELLRELPGVQVAEAGDSDTVIQWLERQPFDLVIVRHLLPSDSALPLVLKKRWPEPVLLLYAPVESEHSLADALATAGDGYFLDSGAALPGLRAAVRLAWGRIRAGRSLPQSDRLRSLEWFAAIFRASPIGIGLGTSDDGRFFDVNDRFLELLGREREETLGRTWAELGVRLEPEHVDGPEVEGAAAASPGLRRASVRFRTKSGEVHQGLLSVQKIRLDGASARLSLLDDLTPLRRAEDQRDRLLESERRARAEAEAALDQLRESHERLESLSRRLVEMQEAERRALARELHDEVGQILASLRLRLEGGTDQAAAEVQAILGELLDRVRGLSMDLRPPTLDELGLLPTLLWHFERYHAETGVRVEFRSRGGEGRFGAGVETTAFRIVQEALTNVARHARVAEVEVSLEATAEGLELRVEDRGCGFEPAAATSGGSGGLAGMQERARLLGGRVRIESTPGRGARVVAELPGSPLQGRAT